MNRIPLLPGLIAVVVIAAGAAWLATPSTSSGNDRGADSRSTTSPGTSGGTTTELCAALSEVATLFTTQQVVTDPAELEQIVNLARAAARYPNEPVMYEGKRLVELTETGSVTVSGYYSNTQYIRVVC